MISIRESISDLEKIDELHHAALECYRAALQDLAQYAVEFDESATASHRQRVTALAGQLQGKSNVPQVIASRSTLRDELRDYHHKASAFLGGLREELSEKAQALELIVDTMATAVGDDQDRFKSSLSKLRELSDSPAASSIRTALATVSEQIAQGVEQIKKQNQLVIGQFRVEIQMLHGQVEALRAVSSGSDSGSGSDSVSTHLNSRPEMETAIARAVEARKPFSLLLLKIRNLAQLERRYGAQVRPEAIAAFTTRARKGISDDAILGRWSEEQFIAIVAVDKVEAMALAKRLAQQFSKPYPSTGKGKPPIPALEVDASVVDSAGGNIYEALIKKVDTYL